MLDVHNRGLGCRTAPAAGGLAVLAVAGLARRRRR
jgi:MYXO-CTERM domain-containing protein